MATILLFCKLMYSYESSVSVHLLIDLLVFCLLNIASFELVKIKIVDAPHHNRHYSSPSKYDLLSY